MLTTTEARGAANWSDRQRALFIAESALSEAVAKVETLRKTNGPSTLQSAVSGDMGGTGFYKREDKEFNALTHWPDKKCAPATSLLAKTEACYVIVFDGLATQENTALVNGSQSPQKSARFTFYAHAEGLRAGTLVVLSTSKAFN